MFRSAVLGELNLEYASESVLFSQAIASHLICLITSGASFGSDRSRLLIGILALLLDSGVSRGPVPILKVGTSEWWMISHGLIMRPERATYTSTPLSKAYATALNCSSLSFPRTADPRLFK